MKMQITASRNKKDSGQISGMGELKMKEETEKEKVFSTPAGLTDRVIKSLDNSIDPLIPNQP